MKIAIPKERRTGETRVAASPDTVKKLVGMGFEVIVEKEAGLSASIPDEQYQEAGATIMKDFSSTVSQAQIVLKVQSPLHKGEGELDEISLLPKDVVLIGMLSPYANREQLSYYVKSKITSFSLEFVPRITRAQSMDVLSSQTNLAGYRAVIEASQVFDRAFPMMMTAAGTIAPARVLILGAGVAGLQAIATARRLGAVVSAFDVRAAAKEQVESLGATFVFVEADESGEGSGGYAKEMSEDYKKRQSAKIKEEIAKNDIVITTALIPGKQAPLLITEDMVQAMKPGSVIVDMAIEAGGNCNLTEVGKVKEKHGVKIVGYPQLATRIPRDSSALYARNILNFLSLLYDKEAKTLKLELEDEILQAAVLTHGGKIIHPQFQS
ncbi:MAG: Re/Si-specific NAD(P)(+) transhydrogenase subunit alpha [Candidatus Paracaedimonas acanthamoebae]|uniref:NAD(P) transhydrogenase subunit alpha part 1 n=1 Tax=Candidatus Paracaedimonas acanthamoebae TaxID=244581 RepID=A0A8J7PIN8_9PROT|nr:Re/Si-specific NAD(P)(+) transhydrogenase subunit alpha [Candidatus Paracaedimonas acanthamoebae]